VGITCRAVKLELSSYAVKYFERFVPQKGIERYPDRESNSDKFYCQTKAT